MHERAKRPSPLPSPYEWYANSSGAQALSIGKGYGALGGRIMDIVGQNLISAIGLEKRLQQGLETIIPTFKDVW